jgi:uncharacterized protein YaeQ
MALGSTMYTFNVELADMDRGVYETLEIRAAQHPSETEEALVTRVLAYCCEYREGIAFSTGISTPDEPAIAVRDLTGALAVWIDIGAPDAARLHKAGKSGARVVVYTHKDPAQVKRLWAGEKMHRADELEFYEVPRAFLDAVVAELSRRMAFTLTVTDRHLYLAVGDKVLDGALVQHRLMMHE